jgi:hypothetical protein
MSKIIRRVVTQRLENDFEVYIDQEVYTPEFRDEFESHFWSIETDEELISSLLWQVAIGGLGKSYEGFGYVKTIRNNRDVVQTRRDNKGAVKLVKEFNKGLVLIVKSFEENCELEVDTEYITVSDFPKPKKTTS